jgi:hypothetical protein
MMGMELVSTIKYSKQIVDVLIGEQKLINGLEQIGEGVKKALVCGAFKE